MYLLQVSTSWSGEMLAPALHDMRSQQAMEMIEIHDSNSKHLSLGHLTTLVSLDSHTDSREYFDPRLCWKYSVNVYNVRARTRGTETADGALSHVTFQM